MSPSGSGKQPTPEERLLKLIRAQQAPPAKSSANAPSSLTGKVKAAPKRVEVASSPFSGKTIAIWALSFLLLAEIGYLIYEVQKPLPVVDAQVPPPKYVSEKDLDLPQPPLSLAQSTQGELFVPPVIVAAKPERQGPSEAIKDLSARLTLMGVIEGDPPQAIIEDSATQKTHFSMQGQMVVEGAYLVEVKSNAAVLELDGEKIFLNL